jgi:hypothetical protein
MIFRLSAILPDRKLLPEAIEIYSELLDDIPNEILKQAEKSCLLNCKFFPTIAEIRERAKPFLEEAIFKIEQSRLPKLSDCLEVCNGNICEKTNTCSFAYKSDCNRRLIENLKLKKQQQPEN